ncbi:OLC1v1017287C1 [Oldenlandia corymbosa var. corymbosa]|uniref:OLC1v1017287C1 n=1 Tax=Oldenlandia corymbosa var. corymbosa TaxID=529605 RepID=A0AAV1E957_OLDCO|nr:OLC1v1017287C1 [Oldenlandia corymbosa var. corymbosa]
MKQEEERVKLITKMKNEFCSVKFVMWITTVFLILVVFHVQSPYYLSNNPGLISNAILPQWKVADSSKNLSEEEAKAKLKASVTFLPLLDLRFQQTALQGNTWFLSSLPDSMEKDEPMYVYVPSDASQDRILCIKGHSTRDGAKNSYALAWKGSLPDSATLLEGLTFISYTFYNHINPWHAISTGMPFVRWSMLNNCSRPNRWILFHQGQFRWEMGYWLDQLMKVYYGNVEYLEKFDDDGKADEEGDGPTYCFEKAVVMRHDSEQMSNEIKLKVFDTLRCKARKFCGLNPIKSRRDDVNEKGEPVIKFTLLDRRETRSYKNTTAVAEIFAKECAMVEGCVFNLVQSEDLSFCDQVRVFSNSDIIASPHGAQITNLFFMDRNSSVMEMFPKGWWEYGPNSRWGHHWLANQSGMKHRGTWWDPEGEEKCSNAENKYFCFLDHYKNGKVGHNATYFAEWGKRVLNEVRQEKLEEAKNNKQLYCSAPARFSLNQPHLTLPRAEIKKALKKDLENLNPEAMAATKKIMKQGESVKRSTKMKNEFCSIKFIMWITFLFLIFVVFRVQTPYYFSCPSSGLDSEKANISIDDATKKLKASVTFLPIKDLRFSNKAMEGNTWFMSSLYDTIEKDEAEYLYFPSDASQDRVLCLKGRDSGDGTKNSYALAWKDSLPESAIFMEGLTFISYTYFNHINLWHGIGTAVPFVRWSMKNGCLRPRRWILYKTGEVTFKMGSWLEQLLKIYYGNLKIEKFEKGDGPYCFEKAVVVRHDTGGMGLENKLKAFDSLRCKARKFCGIPVRTRRNVDERGNPVINFTLLLRKGSRSFKNATVVAEVFSKECAKVEGCVFNLIQSEDLSFCDQVRVMSNSDIVASPHGAQLTNMFFMERNSSVMEFFPKGWLEYAGVGQYAHHWMANQSGMKHRGAWWDSVGNDCPNPKDELQCFLFHKDGIVGHNVTYFSEWGKKVLNEVRQEKLEEARTNQEKHVSNVCPRC